MKQYFNFKRLIEKYSDDFVAVIPSEGGEWNALGDWVAGEPKKVNLRGAIISHRESKIFKAGGTISEKDKALYMLSPLENSLHGAEVIHEGKRYSIGSELENSEFTGVWAYNLKYCSAFDKEGENA